MSARLAAIRRHPIKGHGREPLARVRLTEGEALPWDRHWAVAHEAARLPKPMAWAPCANFSRAAKAPQLMAIASQLDEATGRITLTHPERPDITFDPATEAQAFLDWVRPISPPERALPAALVVAPGRAMTDSDFPSIAILNLASNAALGDGLGMTLSPERWRANLWIEGWEPWVEEAMVGRSLRIGAVVLTVKEQIWRCRATEANPATGRIDAPTLAGLRESRGDETMGLYAVVAEGGEIAVGDPVEVLA